MPDALTLEEADRTRSAVVRALIASAAGIAASGLLLRHREITVAPPGGTLSAHRLAMVALLALVAGAYVALRSDRGGPGRLRVASAWIGFLAVPLGLAHGWWVDPAPAAIAPFWVAALGLGALAFPRGGPAFGGPDDDGRGTR